MVLTIIGFVFIIFGGLNAVRPDIMVRFQVWSQRAVMGSELIPSQRTHTVNRLFGAFFVLLGLALVTGLLK